MSLQVWLPLNGDLHNQGLSNITLINNTANIDNNGKIGKCYNFSSGKSITYNLDISKFNSTAFSFSCWIYISSWNSSYDAILSIANGTGWNNSKATLCRNNTASTLTWNIANDSTSQRISSNTSISLNTWTHIATTYDGAKLRIYINGILDKEGTANLSINYVSNFYLGTWNGGTSYPFNGKLNDVRIYDHCLSVKEVEEIAKGLVLHYKLDNNGMGGNNLAINTANKIVTATATGTDVNSTTALDYGFQSNWANLRGKTITISCDIELINAVNTTGVTNYRVGIEPAIKYTDNTTEYYGIWVALNSTPQTSSKRYSKTVTLPDKGFASMVQNGMYIQHLTNGTATIKNVKVELGSTATPWSPNPADLGIDSSIIYDSSGYGNNGIIVGSLETTTTSLRYSCATKMTNGQYIRVNNRPVTCMPKDAITVNLWQYATSWSIPISCTEGGGWNFENSNGIRFPVYISGVGYKVAQSSITTASTLNAWHMLTGTMDKDNIKIYYDGEEVGTVANGSTNGIGYANNYIFIGAEASGDNTSPANSSYTGNLSDVRIYATALTPEQIKELYNTSMTIDNNGNIHARELVEE